MVENLDKEIEVLELAQHEFTTALEESYAQILPCSEELLKTRLGLRKTKLNNTRKALKEARLDLKSKIDSLIEEVNRLKQYEQNDWELNTTWTGRKP